MTGTVLLAAGGTGGHLFPAEALAAVLTARGRKVALATDKRAAAYGGVLTDVHVLPSETIRGRDPVALTRTAATLSLGVIKALALLGRMKPMAVVGFGGYPTLPPLWAAIFRRVPTLIHDSNAVMGRANRILAPRVSAIATSFPKLLENNAALSGKVRFTGNPIRPAVKNAMAVRYEMPGDEFRLLVFGGSQGARVMSEIVPAAIERLDAGLRGRLTVTQQARPEDIEKVSAFYRGLGVKAEIAAFFRDMPERIARAHLVVSRAGGSTVAELTAIGRPAILVPLPNALDQDQMANATILADAGAGLVVAQSRFTPDLLASELTGLAGAPERLAAMAEAAKRLGTPDAAERLADLVEELSGARRP